MKDALRKLVPVRVRELIRRLRETPLESLPDAPHLFRRYRYFLSHPDVERRPGGWLYQGGFYPDHLTVGGAGQAIFHVAEKFCRGKGLDVGAGLWPLPGSIPVDLDIGPGAGRSVGDFEDGSLDFVFSSHCLEHIDEWREALAAWVDKVRPGGAIFLYLPHPECRIWHPGSPFVGEHHRWIPDPATIKEALGGLGCEIHASDDGPDGMMSFWVCARKR